MKNIIQQINSLLAEISSWFLVVMMFLIIADFVSRGLYHPIQGVSELAVFVLIMVVYLGIPYCEKLGNHVKVSAITRFLPQKIRQLTLSSVYLLMFLFLIFVVFSVGRNFIHAYQSREAIGGAVNLVTWPVKLSIFIGCLFYCLQVLINGINELKKR